MTVAGIWFVRDCLIMVGQNRKHVVNVLYQKGIAVVKTIMPYGLAITINCSHQINSAIIEQTGGTDKPKKQRAPHEQGIGQKRKNKQNLRPAITKVAVESEM
jgi:hypothetical protein